MERDEKAGRPRRCLRARTVRCGRTLPTPRRTDYSPGDPRLRVERKRVVLHLNWILAELQALSEEDVALLRESHVERLRIFEEMEAAGSTRRLRELAEEFDALEYRQQALWGFDPNPWYHRWYDVPGCHCPRHENEALTGIPCRAVSDDCPVHGDGWMPGGIETVELEGAIHA